MTSNLALVDCTFTGAFGATEINFLKFRRYHQTIYSLEFINPNIDGLCVIEFTPQKLQRFLKMLNKELDFELIGKLSI